MSHSILVTGKLHELAIAGLKALPDAEIIYQPDCDRATLLSLIPAAQVLITRSETAVDSQVITAATNLKVIIRAAVGVGNIDLDYATEKGVLVINTPGKNTNSAAEMTMALLLGMLRHTPEAQATLKAGGWERHRFTGHELRGRKLGIVGLGNVGHRVAQFARGFDMEVLGFDPYVNPDKFRRYGVGHCESLASLVAQVDILSVHVPLNKETRGMIGSDLLAKMAGGYVINAARGGIIEEAALVAALAQDQLAGVALDTFDNEPKPCRELIDHPRVYCSPHIGASTEEAQQAIGITVVDQLRKFLEGGVVDHPVNLPELRVIDKPVLKTYAVLIESLGVLMGQLLDFSPQEVTLHYRGDIADLDPALLRISWMKGFASQCVDDYVSYVNAARHIEDLGITVNEAADPRFAGYKSAVKVVMAGERAGQPQSLAMGGVVFDEVYKRISLINDFYFEVEPTDHMIVVENRDEPGVIGHIGMELAQQGVNISTFNLARNNRGGRAMAIVCVDSPPSEACLRALEERPLIEKVHALRL